MTDTTVIPFTHAQLEKFDYDCLPSTEALNVKLSAERIRVKLKRANEDIFEIGQDLLETKRVLGHGNFGNWLKAEFDMSVSTATKIMQVAENLGGKFVTVTNLKTKALYELAAPSTPESVIEEVESRLNAGQAVTAEDIKLLKQQTKEADATADFEAVNHWHGKLIENIEALVKIKNEYDAVSAEMRDRKGWLALGYASFDDYFAAEHDAEMEKSMNEAVKVIELFAPEYLCKINTLAA